MRKLQGKLWSAFIMTLCAFSWPGCWNTWTKKSRCSSIKSVANRHRKSSCLVHVWQVPAADYFNVQWLRSRVLEDIENASLIPWWLRHFTCLRLLYLSTKGCDDRWMKCLNKNNLNYKLLTLQMHESGTHNDPRSLGFRHGTRHHPRSDRSLRRPHCTTPVRTQLDVHVSPHNTAVFASDSDSRILAQRFRVRVTGPPGKKTFLAHASISVNMHGSLRRSRVAG